VQESIKEELVGPQRNLGHLMIDHAIDSGIGLSITIDKLQVFIKKTLSILMAYQLELINRRCLSTVG